MFIEGLVEDLQALQDDLPDSLSTLHPCQREVVNALLEIIKYSMSKVSGTNYGCCQDICLATACWDLPPGYNSETMKDSVAFLVSLSNIGFNGTASNQEVSDWWADNDNQITRALLDALSSSGLNFLEELDDIFDANSSGQAITVQSLIAAVVFLLLGDPVLIAHNTDGLLEDDNLNNILNSGLQTLYATFNTSGPSTWQDLLENSPLYDGNPNNAAEDNITPERFKDIVRWILQDFQYALSQVEILDSDGGDGSGNPCSETQFGLRFPSWPGFGWLFVQVAIGMVGGVLWNIFVKKKWKNFETCEGDAPPSLGLGDPSHPSWMDDASAPSHPFANDFFRIERVYTKDSNGDDSCGGTANDVKYIYLQYNYEFDASWAPAFDGTDFLVNGVTPVSANVTQDSSGNGMFELILGTALGPITNGEMDLEIEFVNDMGIVTTSDSSAPNTIQIPWTDDWTDGGTPTTGKRTITLECDGDEFRANAISMQEQFDWLLENCEPDGSGSGSGEQTSNIMLIVEYFTNFYEQHFVDGFNVIMAALTATGLLNKTSSDFCGFLHPDAMCTAFLEKFICQIIMSRCTPDDCIEVEMHQQGEEKPEQSGVHGFEPWWGTGPIPTPGYASSVLFSTVFASDGTTPITGEAVFIESVSKTIISEPFQTTTFQSIQIVSPDSGGVAAFEGMNIEIRIYDSNTDSYTIAMAQPGQFHPVDAPFSFQYTSNQCYDTNGWTSGTCNTPLNVFRSMAPPDLYYLLQPESMVSNVPEAHDRVLLDATSQNKNFTLFYDGTERWLVWYPGINNQSSPGECGDVDNSLPDHESGTYEMYYVLDADSTPKPGDNGCTDLSDPSLNEDDMCVNKRISVGNACCVWITEKGDVYADSNLVGRVAIVADLGDPVSGMLRIQLPGSSGSVQHPNWLNGITQFLNSTQTWTLPHADVYGQAAGASHGFDTGVNFYDAYDLRVRSAEDIMVAIHHLDGNGGTAFRLDCEDPLSVRNFLVEQMDGPFPAAISDIGKSWSDNPSGLICCPTEIVINECCYPIPSWLGDWLDKYCCHLYLKLPYDPCNPNDCVRYTRDEQLTLVTAFWDLIQAFLESTPYGIPFGFHDWPDTMTRYLNIIPVGKQLIPNLGTEFGGWELGCIPDPLELVLECGEVCVDCCEWMCECCDPCDEEGSGSGSEEECPGHTPCDCCECAIGIWKDPTINEPNECGQSTPCPGYPYGAIVHLGDENGPCFVSILDVDCSEGNVHPIFDHNGELNSQYWEACQSPYPDCEGENIDYSYGDECSPVLSENNTCVKAGENAEEPNDGCCVTLSSTITANCPISWEWRIVPTGENNYGPTIVVLGGNGLSPDTINVCVPNGTHQVNLSHAGSNGLQTPCLSQPLNACCIPCDLINFTIALAGTGFIDGGCCDVAASAQAAGLECGGEIEHAFGCTTGLDDGKCYTITSDEANGDWIYSVGCACFKFVALNSVGEVVGTWLIDDGNQAGHIGQGFQMDMCISLEAVSLQLYYSTDGGTENSWLPCWETTLDMGDCCGVPDCNEITGGGFIANVQESNPPTCCDVVSLGSPGCDEYNVLDGICNNLNVFTDDLDCNYDWVFVLYPQTQGSQIVGIVIDSPNGIISQDFCAPQNMMAGYIEVDLFPANTFNNGGNKLVTCPITSAIITTNCEECGCEVNLSVLGSSTNTYPNPNAPDCDENENYCCCLALRDREHIGTDIDLFGQPNYQDCNSGNAVAIPARCFNVQHTNDCTNASPLYWRAELNQRFRNLMVPEQMGWDAGASLVAAHSPCQGECGDAQPLSGTPYDQSLPSISSGQPPSWVVGASGKWETENLTTGPAPTPTPLPTAPDWAYCLVPPVDTYNPSFPGVGIWSTWELTLVGYPTQNDLLAGTNEFCCKRSVMAPTGYSAGTMQSQTNGGQNSAVPPCPNNGPGHPVTIIEVDPCQAGEGASAMTFDDDFRNTAAAILPATGTGNTVTYIFDLKTGTVDDSNGTVSSNPNYQDQLSANYQIQNIQVAYAAGGNIVSITTTAPASNGIVQVTINDTLPSAGYSEFEYFYESDTAYSGGISVSSNTSRVYFNVAAAVDGCTDNNALNYNPAATFDDGSCELACDGITADSAGVALYNHPNLGPYTYDPFNDLIGTAQTAFTNLGINYPSQVSYEIFLTGNVLDSAGNVIGGGVPLGNGYDYSMAGVPGSAVIQGSPIPITDPLSPPIMIEFTFNGSQTNGTHWIEYLFILNGDTAFGQ